MNSIFLKMTTFCIFPWKGRCLKLMVLSLLLTVSFSMSIAQTLELGLIAGGANYQGDLASSEFSVLKQQTDFAIGGFLRYTLNESFGVKLQIVKTELSGDDANSSLDFLQQRNLRFFSPLVDASLRMEWYPFTAGSEFESIIIPYLSVGGSFFSFNPQATYRG